MGVQVSFSKGRLYFDGFNESNDVDPKTQRSGVNYFRFNLIGQLLQFLGFAYKIHYKAGQQEGIVYVNSKSFLAWKERHRQDAGLNVESLDQAFTQKSFERAVKIICENFVKHKAHPLRSLDVSGKDETPPPSQIEINTQKSPLQDDPLSASEDKPMLTVQEGSNNSSEPLELRTNPETQITAPLSKIKEEIFAQLGLNSSPPQPLQSTPIRTPEDLVHDLSLYDSKIHIRVDSNRISQKYLIDIIKKIHNKLLYISFEKFQDDLKALTQQLLNTTNGQPYFVATASGKSNTWVAEQALNHLDVKDLPKGKFELALYESSETLPNFKEAIENGTKKFVIFDDVIYTGSQMKSHILRIIRAFRQFKDQDLELILVVPYVTEVFKTKVSEHLKNVKLLTTQTTIPHLTEALTPSEIQTLKNVYPESSCLGYLVYTDWKVADAKSVPEFLHHGFKLKEGIFRFMRSNEPLYPPYKERETLDACYAVSSHPFDNPQTIQFED